MLAPIRDKSSHSVALKNLTKVWKTETEPLLSCLKSYHIRISESPANQHSQSSPDGPNRLC